MRYVVDIEIGRKADDVFAFLSDLRNELSWNRRAKRVTKLTPGPVAIGTRFEAKWSGVPKTVVELIAYQPPRMWETRSRSLGMDVVFRGSLEPSEAATRYLAAVTVEPHGWARLYAPLAVWAMRRQEALNLRRIKDLLEYGAAVAGATREGRKES